MNKGEKKDQRKDPFDGEYMGNIWGWKFSFIGLALIVVLLGIIVYRHWSMDVPIGLEEEQNPDTGQDTIDINN